MFVRKSGAADSSVLSHPMLWLDERIFGWSRSASVGQSVWNSTKMDRSRSEPSTAPGSPADSDNEEYEADVDYDDVSVRPLLPVARYLVLLVLPSI
jgi:glycerol-3-phosphate O-acyltransferase/dihydroxyacetone phosphate acyltransferase